MNTLEHYREFFCSVPPEEFITESWVDMIHDYYKHLPFYKVDPICERLRNLFFHLDLTPEVVLDQKHPNYQQSTRKKRFTAALDDLISYNATEDKGIALNIQLKTAMKKIREGVRKD